MTLGYRQAKARVNEMAPADRDAFLSRLLAYRQEVDRAAGPWAAVGMLVTLAGIGLLIWPATEAFRGLPFYLGLLVLFAAGGGLQMLATKKKRDYERAHPFEG